MQPAKAKFVVIELNHRIWADVRLMRHSGSSENELSLVVSSAFAEVAVEAAGRGIQQVSSGSEAMAAYLPSRDT